MLVNSPNLGLGGATFERRVAPSTVLASFENGHYHWRGFLGFLGKTALNLRSEPRERSVFAIDFLLNAKLAANFHRRSQLQGVQLDVLKQVLNCRLGKPFRRFFYKG